MTIPVRRIHRAITIALPVLLVVALGRVMCADDTPPSIPETVHMDPELRPLVEALLEESATFRSQFARIACQPRVYVRATIDPRLEASSFRARTVIRRANDGALVALIYLPPFGDQIEWLAHEFEHVIEQLEGVRLGALAAGQHGAWRTGENTFETWRAIRAGHAVLDEVGGRGGLAVRAARARRERAAAGGD